MNQARCVGEPVSWLRLERYLLGELPAAEGTAVAAHLRACPACAAVERDAQQPLALPVLATVPEPGTTPPAAGATLTGAISPERPVPIAKVSILYWISAALFGTRPAGVVSRMALVAAAALVLVLTRAPADRPNELARGAGETMAGVKGGHDQVGIELLRERGGVVASGATTFVEDDRWKVLVTCPSGRVRFWEVVVRDGAAWSFPFSWAPSSPLTCGNRVALPGALHITGARTNDVCVVLGDAPPDRTRLTALDARELAAAGACVTLHPEAPAP